PGQHRVPSVVPATSPTHSLFSIMLFCSSTNELLYCLMLAQMVKLLQENFARKHTHPAASGPCISPIRSAAMTAPQSIEVPQVDTESSAEVKRKDRAHVFHTWSAQAHIDPRSEEHTSELQSRF